jgi:hypothetical protein
MKEISSMDFPQHGEVFYFYGQALNQNSLQRKKFLKSTILRRFISCFLILSYFTFLLNE